jgi:hypothetical protein
VADTGHVRLDRYQGPAMRAGAGWQEYRAIARKEVVVRAIDGRPTWITAADILGITPRHMRRLKLAYEHHGYGGLVDQRGIRPRRRRVPVKTI